MKRRVASVCAGVLSLLVAAGCAGGDEAAPGGGASKPSSNQEELVSADFLADVARRTEQLSSMSGEFAMDFEVDGESISMSGDMAVEDGLMYMDMRLFGQRVQILSSGYEMYMHFPDEGWFSSTPSW